MILQNIVVAKIDERDGTLRRPLFIYIFWIAYSYSFSVFHHCYLCSKKKRVSYQFNSIYCVSFIITALTRVCDSDIVWVLRYCVLCVIKNKYSFPSACRKCIILMRSLTSVCASSIFLLLRISFACGDSIWKDLVFQLRKINLYISRLTRVGYLCFCFFLEKFLNWQFYSFVSLMTIWWSGVCRSVAFVSRNKTVSLIAYGNS